MAWPNFSRKTQSGPIRTGEPTGLELNSSNLRAVYGRGPQTRPMLLDDVFEDLPLAINLDRRIPEVGRSAIAQARKSPHLSCLGYLSQLGDPTEWRAGRIKLDAIGALQLVFERVHPTLEGATALAMALPTYLTPLQVQTLLTIATRTKLSTSGTIVWPLAVIAQAATIATESVTLVNRTTVKPVARDREAILLVDADDSSMSIILMAVERDQAEIIGAMHLPSLSRRVWTDRMLNSMADRCIRVCRRDPRDDANAEQMLVDQFDTMLDQVRLGQRVNLSVRSERWYQDLIYQPEEIDATCPSLIHQSLDAVRDLIASTGWSKSLRSIWLTHAAGRLPGLSTALMTKLSPEADGRWLQPQAIARATCALLDRWRDGQLPRTHVDRLIRLDPA